MYLEFVPKEKIASSRFVASLPLHRELLESFHFFFFFFFARGKWCYLSKIWLHKKLSVVQKCPVGVTTATKTMDRKDIQMHTLVVSNESDLISRTIGVVLYCYFLSFLALWGQKRPTRNNSFLAQEISTFPISSFRWGLNFRRDRSKEQFQPRGWVRVTVVRTKHTTQ